MKNKGLIKFLACLFGLVCIFQLVLTFQFNQIENRADDHIINLVDRSKEGIDFGYPSTALLNLPSESWEPQTCPLCEIGEPLSERGRTGKMAANI